LLAIKYDHGPQTLWYNADRFKRHGAGAPTDARTRDDVQTAAERVTTEGEGLWGIMDSGPRGGLVCRWGSSAEAGAAGR
jgi:ABC-type glycerol-3-phosphate transport system substrate-binding protein